MFLYVTYRNEPKPRPSSGPKVPIVWQIEPCVGASIHRVRVELTFREPQSLIDLVGLLTGLSVSRKSKSHLGCELFGNIKNVSFTSSPEDLYSLSLVEGRTLRVCTIGLNILYMICHSERAPFRWCSKNFFDLLLTRSRESMYRGF